MKVLLVNGSPHKRGTTAAALSELAASLQAGGVETEVFHLGNKPVRGCVACNKCRSTGMQCCAFEDDICNALIAKFQEADGIVLGSPTYYAGPNGALCAVLDRVFYSAQETFRCKPGASVIACRRGGASTAFDRLNRYFGLNQMPVVGSQYWNIVYGTSEDEAKLDVEGMQTMRTLGKNMAWVLKGLEGQPLPEVEPRTPLNFIH